MLTFVLQNCWLNTSSFSGHLDVVKALIKAGATISQADKDSTHICSVIVIHSHKIYMCTQYNIIPCDKSEIIYRLSLDKYMPLFVYM